MSGIVIKIDRDTDRYVYWSTVVEVPHMHGTRAQVVSYLERYESYGDLDTTGRDAIEARMQRADATGTSALNRDYYGWYDDILIVEQRGILKRANLWAFAEAYFGGEGRRDEWLDLLEPFDDCMEHITSQGENGCPVLPCPDHVVNRA